MAHFREFQRDPNETNSDEEENNPSISDKKTELFIKTEVNEEIIIKSHIDRSFHCQSEDLERRFTFLDRQIDTKYVMSSVVENVATENHSQLVISRQNASSLFVRVIYAALPIQLLQLLFLFLAFLLVPICDDEYNCLVRNNFKYSFSEMLKHNNGPPPT